MTHINSLRPNAHTLVRIAALAALTIALLVGAAGTAGAHHVTTTVNEGFEQMHPGLSFPHYGPSTGSQLVLNRFPTPLNPQRARTGIGHAYMWSGGDQSGAMVQRRITKPANHLSCYAWAYVNPEGRTKTVYFEAYNPATPNARLMVSARPTVAGTSYQQISTGYFYAPVSDIVVRVGIGGNVGGLRVDDMRVSCVSFD
jgi:hypothetical protein